MSRKTLMLVLLAFMATLGALRFVDRPRTPDPAISHPLPAAAGSARPLSAPPAEDEAPIAASLPAAAAPRPAASRRLEALEAAVADYRERCHEGPRLKHSAERAEAERAEIAARFAGSTPTPSELEAFLDAELEATSLRAVYTLCLRDQVVALGATSPDSN